MATGVVYYWNGQSGWIKLDDVSDVPTQQANDVLVLMEDVTFGTISQDCAVSFTIDPDRDPWLAREVTVT